jgi:hypothetical protein
VRSTGDRFSHITKTPHTPIHGIHTGSKLGLCYTTTRVLVASTLARHPQLVCQATLVCTIQSYHLRWIQVCIHVYSTGCV